MRRNHALRRLKPEGLWRPPLTDEQVAQAIEFGTTVSAQGDFAVHDVFLVEFNQALNATIFLSTAFERLAVYASQQARRGIPVDATFVDTVRHLPNSPDALRVRHYISAQAPKRCPVLACRKQSGDDRR